MRRAFMAALLLAACGSPEPEALDVALTASAAGNPTVAVHASGNASAAWIENGNVYLAVIDSAGVATRVRVNDIDGDAAPHEQAPPQVAAGPDGAIYVVWQNNTVIPGRRFPTSNLRFARSLDGGRTFEPAVFVNDDAEGEPASHTFQDIAVADDGTIYISWIDGRARAGEASHTDHAMGPDVRVARSTDGGRTFGVGVIARRNVCPCCRTSLAVGPDGVVAVSFRSATDNIRDIAVVRSTDGGTTFGEPVTVHRDGWQVDACPHAGASLALGSDGRMHIAWYTGAESRQGVWYAVSSPDGSSFGEPQPLLTGGWIPVSQVKLAAAADGSIWIAWDDRREERGTIRLAVDDGRGPRTLDGVIAGRSPAIAAAENVAVVWHDGANASARLLTPR